MSRKTAAVAGLLSRYSNEMGGGGGCGGGGFFHAMQNDWLKSRWMEYLEGRTRWMEGRAR